MKTWFLFVARRLFLLIFLLAAGLPGRAQDQAAPESEKARQLTERVDQLYQLFVSGGWREVEAFVSEDTQDIWLTQAKSTIIAFEIKEVKVAPDGQRADVTVRVSFRIMQVPNAPFQQPQKSEWVYENNQWFIKLKPPASVFDMFQSSSVQSNPVVAKSPIAFEQNPVKISPPETGTDWVVQIPYQNVSSNIVTIQDLNTTCLCLQASVDKKIVQQQETGTLTLTYNSSIPNTSGHPLAVRAVLAPKMFLLDLPVELSNE